VIPDSVVSIGDSAFEGAVKLSTVVLGENVEYIGTSAFENCTELSRVQYSGVNEPELGEDVFAGTQVTEVEVTEKYKGDDFGGTSVSVKSKKGLSGGAIAGIVIGVIAALLIAGGVVFFFMKKKSGAEEKSEVLA
jgi:hypothetical protein